MKTTDNEPKEAKYPYYDLEAAINFASSIKDLGGSKGGIKKSIIAKQVGLAESTPSFFQKLSAAKTYGIIEGWGSYGLTELGRKYFYPTTEKDAQEARLTMFTVPELFKRLVARFDGEKLPTTGILGNILHQESAVPDSWKDRVAQIFIRNAHFTGIIDDASCLRYDAAMHTRKPGTAEASEAPPNVDFAMLPADPSPAGTNSWSFSASGKQIRVQTPEVISKELWDKLNAYVQILKPSDE